MAVFAKQHSQSAFFNLFPPPVFLAMPTVGMDVSDRTVKFVELKSDEAGLVPSRFGGAPLAEGGVVGGAIRNPDVLREGLLKLQRRHGFRFVRASLPEQQAYVFTTSIPVTKDEQQLSQMIEFKLEENVPIAPQNAIFGYDVLSTEEKEGGEMDVAVTVYPRKAVNQYVETFEAAGLTPLSLEIESQAIARAIIPRGDQATYLVVDFGETRSGLAIVRDELLSFTTTLEVSGRELTNAIEKEFGVEGKDIARIKNEQGIWAKGSKGQMHAAVIEVISRLTDEVERHHHYWESLARGKGEDQRKIQKILLCGGNANLAGLPEYMASSLKIPVERANVWLNAFSFEHFVPEMPFERSLSYATAVGLALRDA